MARYRDQDYYDYPRRESGGTLANIAAVLITLIIIALSLIGLWRYRGAVGALLTAPSAPTLASPTAAVSRPPQTGIRPLAPRPAAAPANVSAPESAGPAAPVQSAPAAPVVNPKVDIGTAPDGQTYIASDAPPPPGMAPTTTGFNEEADPVVNPVRDHVCGHGAIWVDDVGCANPVPLSPLLPQSNPAPVGDSPPEGVRVSTDVQVSGDGVAVSGSASIGNRKADTTESRHGSKADTSGLPPK